MDAMGQELRSALDRFHDDPETSWTLPGHLYHRPEIFEAERRAIFQRNWIQVAHAEELANTGDYLTVDIGGQDILVVRGKDARLRAFYNVCQHRGHDLLRGSGNVARIVCPYHAWTYRLDGRLQGAPYADAAAYFDKSAICLTPVRVEEFCRFVFVNLDPNARSVAETYPGLEDEVRRYTPNLDRLTHAYRCTFDLAANWKVVVENYLECYHCYKVHPALSNDFDMEDYGYVLNGNYTSTYGYQKASDAPVSFDFRGASQGVQCNWWIWPYVMWEQFPGRGSVMVYNHVPISAERTLQIVDFYFEDKQGDATERGQIEYVERTLRLEDKAICEGVQRGLHSRGYTQGKFIIDPTRRAGWSEHAVHHFQRLYKSAMNF